MPAHTGLTAPMFGSPDVMEIFSGAGLIRRMLDVEGALARAEARCGVIPAAAAATIADVCAQPEDGGRQPVIDAEALAQGAIGVGNLAIPFVKQLTAAVAARDETAGRYVHWGATSQDILDTALVLQLVDALRIQDGRLTRLADDCAGLARRHRDTVMVARTWQQHALPTTFGLKAAGWLDALRRDLMRLQDTRGRVRVLQFGGAAGTLASLGPTAPDVAACLAGELALAPPALPWHTHRDRLVEVASTLGMLCGTLGKMARDISLMMQTEVAEVAEPAGAGRGGSSTMPHKRNPVGCAAVLAIATRVPALVSTMFSAMPQEHERALGGWQAEWDTLPDIVASTAGALRQMGEIIAGLEVDAARMRANLDLTGGLILGEAYMLALGQRLGRLPAHHLVECASRDAVAANVTLLDALRKRLAADPALAGLLDDADLEQLADPTRYTGQAARYVDAVLTEWQAARGAQDGAP
ncbi:3-carboxy-cis,cis-muconate cycloisomerase [Achromobacter aloeverae]|uniref:3-carboxy-cis,cis-muconate cycloisomerase n=1 Tax=Achromobacter aloeverae TaxID=1750518 RepID=A0A4Q1HE14_9BURK|nr:3-carboxy-cis,cis-muconate cycloisomerase [Achromobacter aloeverae]RXN83640.1 3-carboxy-cis,cis-muconate cycloisomerase [Achromobacter aloeverae]